MPLHFNIYPTLRFNHLCFSALQVKNKCDGITDTNYKSHLETKYFETQYIFTVRKYFKIFCFKRWRLKKKCRLFIYLLFFNSVLCGISEV